MPNGYTADIYEGKPTTLADYLMGVGRGMGFAIMQRDDPASEPVRRVEPQTRYYDEALAEARAVLADLDGLTMAQAAERASAEYEAEVSSWLEERDRRLGMRSRYVDMIAQVEAWEPDPLVRVVKEQAIKYLRESLDFDVGPEGEEMRYRPYPRLLGGAEWVNAKRAKAQRDVEYNEAERAKEIERAAERNRWIDAFLGSLPARSEAPA